MHDKFASIRRDEEGHRTVAHSKIGGRFDDMLDRMRSFVGMEPKTKALLGTVASGRGRYSRSATAKVARKVT